jgi:hypothetical protein
VHQVDTKEDEIIVLGVFHGAQHRSQPRAAEPLIP